MLFPLDYVKSRVLVCPILKEAMVYSLWCIKCIITYLHRIKLTFLNATLMPLNYTSYFFPTGNDLTIADTSRHVNGTLARMNALRSQLMRAITKMQSAEPGCKRNFIFMMLYLHTFKSVFYLCIWPMKLVLRFQSQGGLKEFD